ncbi:MAG: hypothetical protein U9N07_02925 [Euryarchaeota archaeon]|nr:hypothetical protein [Euryarchaeota archaeon]
MTCYRLQITDYGLLPEGRMDGVIVTVVHDEFRGMGLRVSAGFWRRGGVVDVRGMFEGMEAEGMGFIERRGEESYNSVQLIYIQK